MHRAFRCGLIGILFAAGVTALLWQGTATPPANAQAADYWKVEELKHKGYVETIPGSKVKFDMVAIPGGSFVMGSPASEAGREADEGPQHPVKVRPFWMGKCEVTWDEFDLFWKKDKLPLPPKPTPGDKEADAITRPTPTYVDETYGHPREGHPVMCMSHHCAMEYCRWLSAKTGKVYRLPTEAEWEWAARAGTKTAYYFGADPAKLADYAWYAKNSGDSLHKVGTRKPNAWGLHDMYGNVMEWCLDHYTKDSYSKFPAGKLTLSPVLVPTDKRFSHVARGGSWADEAKECRSAARRGSDKEWIKDDPQRPQSIWWLTKMDVVGIRLVCPVEEQDNLKGLKSKVTKESD
jgi:formylglycine-generating enzyme required for sulfatase activity